MKRLFFGLAVIAVLIGESLSDSSSQGPKVSKTKEKSDLFVLKPARVFDGVAAEAHEGWIVVVRGKKIDSAGPADKISIPKNAKVIELPRRRSCPA